MCRIYDAGSKEPEKLREFYDHIAELPLSNSIFTWYRLNSDNVRIQCFGEEMETTLSFDELPSAIVKPTRQLDKLEALIRESNKPKPSDKLFTVHEAAEFLNLSVATIYTKVSRGELPYMKRAKRLYFSKKELVEYLKAGQVQTAKEIQAEAGQFLK